MAMRTFTINGTKSDTWGMLTEIRRPMNNPISINEVKVPLRVGSYVSKFNYKVEDSRIIQAKLFIQGTTYLDLRSRERDLAYFFRNFNRDGLAKPLKFSDDIVTYDVFYFGDGEWEELKDGMSAIATLNFLCPNGFGYDATLKTTTFVGSTASYNTVGTAETSPIITYTFNASQPSITFTHTPTGKKIILTKSFVSGNVVNIDCDRNVIFDETGISLMSSLDITSRFFEFAPKENSTITVDRTTFSSTQIRWYDRYA